MKLHGAFVGVTTAKPVDAMRFGEGFRQRKYEPRSGRTVDNTVSPWRSLRRARLGSSPRWNTGMLAMLPRDTSEISTYSTRSSSSPLLRVHALMSHNSEIAAYRQPLGRSALVA